MAAGFKVADAYADFHVDVDKAIQDMATKIRAKSGAFDKMGEGAAANFSQGFGKRLKLTEHVDREIDKLKATGNKFTRLGEQAGEGYARGFKNGANLRPAMSEQIAVVKSAKPAFEVAGRQAGESYAKGFGGQKITAGTASVSSNGSGVAAGEQLGDGVVQGYRRKVKEVDKDTEKVAARTQATFKALAFAGAFAGLPAAAAVGALGVTAVLGAVPIAFVAMGAMAAMQTKEVQSAVNKMAGGVGQDIDNMSGAFTGQMVDALHKGGDAFGRMRPQISEAMETSAGYVGVLTGAVTDFAEEAMPGMVVAVHSAEAPLDGLRSLAGQTGAGLTDMWINAAKGADSAGRNLKTTGGIIRDLEGFAGSLFANLSNGGEVVLPQFRSALSQVYGVVNTLTTNGMPALQGATQGMLGVTGGGIAIVNAFASGLGNWTAPLGNAAGSLFAANSMAKLFGTSIGQTGLGIGAFATTTDAAGTKTNAFKTAVGNAEGATGKLKAGVGSLVSSGLNPMGLVLGIATIGLSEIGRRQQEAAEKTAAHREAVRELTQAYREDNGVMGQAVKASLDKQLTDKNAAGNAKALGVSLNMVTDASQGNAASLSALKGRTDKLIDGMVESGAVSETSGASLKKVGDKLRDLGGASSDFVHDWGNMTQAQKDAVIANENLQGAVGASVRQAREAHDAYVASVVGLTGWSAGQVEAAMDVNAHTSSLYEQQNALMGVRGAEINTKLAMEDLDKVNKNSKSTDAEKAAALFKVEQSFIAQENAAYQNAFALNANKTDVERLTAANTAANSKMVELANTMKGPLPESMQASISKFTVAEATAAGLTIGINKTGEAVYRLPNGKEIKINADTNPADVKIADLRGRLNAIDGKIITSYIDVVTRYKSVGTAGVRTGVNAPDFYVNGPHAAVGGPVSMAPVRGFAGGGLTGPVDVRGGGELRGPGTGTSDSILMMTSSGPAAGSDDEFVVKAKQAKKYRRLLFQINNDTLSGYANGGLVGAAQEMLGQLQSGGQFFEDFSYHGASADVSKYNDQIAALFGQSRAKGWNFDGSPGGADRTKSDITQWLTSYIAKQSSNTAAAGGQQITNNYYNTFNIPATDPYALATIVTRELELRSKTGAS